MNKSLIRSKKVKKILYYPRKNYRNAIRTLKMLTKTDFMSIQNIAEKLGNIPHLRTKLQLEYLAELGYVDEYGLVWNSDHPCEFCKKSKRFLTSRDLLDSAKETLENNKQKRELAKKKKDYNPKNWFHCKDGHVLGRLVWLECFSCYKHVEEHKDEEYKIQQDRYWTLSYNGMLVMLGLLTSDQLNKFIEKHTNNEIFELVNALLKSQNKNLAERLLSRIKKNMDTDPLVIKYAEGWYDEMKPIVFRMKVDANRFPELAKFKREHDLKFHVQIMDELNRKIKYQ